MTTADRFWLSEAIRISRLAPQAPDRYAVGAVIVDGDGTVLSTGYTGETHPHHHAEEEALARLADKALELGASVHMPRIGCGLAGGTWSRVEPLITERLVRRGIAVTVYDHGD